MNELDVLRSVDFDWAMRLSEVWDDAAWDVPELHANLRAEFGRKLEGMREPRRRFAAGLGHRRGRRDGEDAPPRGVPPRGDPEPDCAFVLVDMTDVRVFWETVLQGYIDSLQQSFEGDRFQYQWVLRNIIGRLGPSKPVAEILTILAERKSQDFMATSARCSRPSEQDPPEGDAEVPERRPCPDLPELGGLLDLQPGDDLAARAGPSKTRRGKRSASPSPASSRAKIVEALSWFMSLSGPTVLAFDQLDPIVTQLHYRKQGDQSSEEQATAESIIVEIGSGLGSLRDMTRNTLTVISCVESTWEILGGTVLKTFIDRFEHALEAGRRRQTRPSPGPSSWGDWRSPSRRPSSIPRIRPSRSDRRHSTTSRRIRPGRS